MCNLCLVCNACHSISQRKTFSLAGMWLSHMTFKGISKVFWMTISQALCTIPWLWMLLRFLSPKLSYLNLFLFPLILGTEVAVTSCISLSIGCPLWCRCQPLWFPVTFTKSATKLPCFYWFWILLEIFSQVLYCQSTYASRTGLCPLGWPWNSPASRKVSLLYLCLAIGLHLQPLSVPMSSSSLKSNHPFQLLLSSINMCHN